MGPRPVRKVSKKTLKEIRKALAEYLKKNSDLTNSPVPFVTRTKAFMPGSKAES